MMCGMSGRSICKIQWMMVCTVHDQRERCKFLTHETAEEDDGSSRKVVADKSVPWPPHLSTYYSRYYWWEIIAYNIDITGLANFGRNMRYYWMGRSYIKYAILLGWPSIYNIRFWGVSPASPHIKYVILLCGPNVYNMQYYWVSPPPPHIIYAILLGGPAILYM